MTDQTTADIARHLREYAQQLRGSTHVRHTGADLIEQAADALEASERRAEGLSRDAAIASIGEFDDLHDEIDRLTAERDAAIKEMHARELHHFEEEERTAGLAAVAEKVRLYCENQGDKFRHHAGRILDMLAASPADALREVKAIVWDEGVNAEAHAAVTTSPRIKNPYRAQEEER